MTKLIGGHSLAEWVHSHPMLPKLIDGEPLCWINASKTPFSQAQNDVGLGWKDIEDAAARLQRFAPYLAAAFPDAAPANGLVESPLRRVPSLAECIASRYGVQAPEKLFIKLDSELPISGSVKARGGIYEVLLHAERLALASGLLNPDSAYEMLLEDAARSLFSRHAIVVGSTGNLGMAIGLAASRLGFSATVHMSNDAKAWKKERLRSNGVRVVEHAGDYGLAVERGREASDRDPSSYFVDDEQSRALFLGYSVAGLRLKAQLHAQGVEVDAAHPLVVYLPCGVGGAPGGISFGLKHAFGDNVYCIFAEPTQSPCMLLGLYTGLHDKIAVGDFGISNHTLADGLAVGRPSGFVGPAMRRIVDGVYTLPDEEMLALLAIAYDAEGLKLEPSALAGAPGFARVNRHGPVGVGNLGIPDSVWKAATHVIWATGGGLVPADEHERCLNAGRQAMRSSASVAAGGKGG